MRINRNKKADLKSILIVLVFIIYLLGASYLSIRFTPDTYIGENALKEIRNSIIIDAAVIVPLFIFMIIYLIIPIITIMRMIVINRRIDRVKEELFNMGVIGDEINGRISIKYVSLFVISFIIAFLIFVDFTSDSSDLFVKYTDSATSEIKLLKEIDSDIKADETVIGIYSEANIYGGGLECYDEHGYKCRFILSSSDYNRISNKICGYKEYTVTAEFYKESKILKSLDISGKKTDSAIQTQEEAAEVYPYVEISMDDYYVYRPENMEEYGQIAWVVECDGKRREKLHEVWRNGKWVFETSDLDPPYDILAEYYTSADLLAESKHLLEEPGDYEVYLVKVIVSQNEEGLYTNYKTYRISDSITFTLNEGIKNRSQYELKKMDKEIMDSEIE